MLRMECAKFDLCFTCEGIDSCDTLALSRRLRKDLPNHRLATLIAELGIELMASTVTTPLTTPSPARGCFSS